MIIPTDRYLYSLLPIRSVSSSMSRTSSLGWTLNADEIFHIVSKLACFLPLSIMARWLLAIPARPLRTSCDIFFSQRSFLMAAPVAYLLNSAIGTPPSQFKFKKFSGKSVYLKWQAINCLSFLAFIWWMTRNYIMRLVYTLFLSVIYG